MSDNLDQWLNSGGTHIDDAKKERAERKDAKPALSYTPLESAARGLGSGLLMGFQPQIAGALTAMNPFTDQTYAQSRDESAQKNEQAWQENPYSYGAGYTGGMLGTGLVGGLGKAFGTGVVEGASRLGAGEIAANIASKPGLRGAVQNATSDATASIGSKITGKVPAEFEKMIEEAPTATQSVINYLKARPIDVGTRVVGGATNRPDEAPMIPPRIIPIDPTIPPGYMAPVPENFNQLKSFLAQHEDNNLARRRYEMTHKTVQKD